MPANMSDFMESGLINFFLRGNTNNFNKAANLFLALCSGVPSDNNNGTNIPELPNANGYARYNIGPLSNSTWTEIIQTGANSGLTQNVGAWNFAAATGDWGYVSGVAIVDSGVIGTGNMWMWGTVQTPRDVKNQDTYSYAASAFQIAFD